MDVHDFLIAEELGTTLLATPTLTFRKGFCWLGLRVVRGGRAFFLANTGATKIILVAHSFGGLVARSYLEGLATPTFDSSGTPLYFGSPDAYAGDVAALLTLDTPRSPAYRSICLLVLASFKTLSTNAK